MTARMVDEREIAATLKIRNAAPKLIFELIRRSGSITRPERGVHTVLPLQHGEVGLDFPHRDLVMLFVIALCDKSFLPATGR